MNFPLAVVPIPSADPRCAIGAYITDGVHLREVTKRDTLTLTAEDCKDGVPWIIEYTKVVMNWTLVKAAPSECPDTLEEIAA